MVIGEARIGLALSDPTGTLCTPLMTLNTKGPPDDQQRIAEIAAEHDVEAIVVGLPVNITGTSSLTPQVTSAKCG